MQAGCEVSPGVIAIPVPRPARALLDAVVALKRRAIGRAAGEASSGAPVPRPSGHVLGELRDLYFRVLHIVDDCKKWSWLASKAAARAGKQYRAAVVLASGPPYSGLLSGARAARKLGVPYVADLRDPWSDAALRANPTARFEHSVQRALEGLVMRRAATVTSTGATVATLLAERYPDLRQRIRVIRNGYDGTVAPRSVQTAGRLSILFAGELYIGRDPFPFLTALEWLLERPGVDVARVRATFMGRVSVYAGQSLPAWLAGRRCESAVRILPPQSRAEVAAAAASATVLLNLAQQQPLSVPAKTFEHLSSGREVLLLCEKGCETASLVAGISGVNVVDPSDPDALKACLLDLYQRHVLQGEATVPAAADVGRFSRANANADFHEVLAALAGTAESPREN